MADRLGLEIHCLIDVWLDGYINAQLWQEQQYLYLTKSWFKRINAHLCLNCVDMRIWCLRCISTLFSGYTWPSLFKLCGLCNDQRQERPPWLFTSLSAALSSCLSLYFSLAYFFPSSDQGSMETWCRDAQILTIECTECFHMARGVAFGL